MQKVSYSVENVCNFVRFLILLLCSSLLIGHSVSYIVFGVLVVCSFLLIFADLEFRGYSARYLYGNLGIWGVLIGFAIVVVVVAGLSPLAGFDSASEIKWVLYVVGAVIPISVVHRRSGFDRSVRSGLYLFLFVILISVISSVNQFLSHSNPFRELMGGEIHVFDRVTGLLRNPIPFSHVMGGVFWVSALTFVFSLSKRRPLVAYAAISVGLASFLCVLMTQTRGAWLAIPVVGLVSVFLFRGRERLYWLRALCIACVLGVVAIAADNGIRDRFLGAFDVEESTNRKRIDLWHANYSILSEHPFGIGYGAGALIIEDKFDELGLEKHDALWHSHNEFVEVAVGSGWLGIALYLFLSAWLFLRVVFALRAVDPSDEARRWSAFLLFASALLQVFLQVCALTDAMSPPGRFLLCMAWAVAIVVPTDLASERASERAGARG